MAPLERVTVLMTLIRQLETLMQRETEALKAMRMAEIEDLQEEKNLLAEAYEIEMRKLRNQPEILGALEPHVRQTLDEAVRSLQATGRRNANALNAARTVIERLVSTLGKAVQQSTYGGRYAAPSAAQNAQQRGQVISVAFDRAI